VQEHLTNHQGIPLFIAAETDDGHRMRRSSCKTVFLYLDGATISSLIWKCTWQRGSRARMQELRQWVGRLKGSGWHANLQPFSWQLKHRSQNTCSGDVFCAFLRRSKCNLTFLRSNERLLKVSIEIPSTMTTAAVSGFCVKEHQMLKLKDNDRLLLIKLWLHKQKITKTNIYIKNSITKVNSNRVIYSWCSN
jgi:hypothetical protein